MLTIILVSAFYLAFLSFMLIYGTYAKAGIGEKPLVYSSKLISGLLGLASLVWFIFTVVLALYNWKWLAILLVVGFFLGKPFLVPLTERFLIFPFSSWLVRKGKEKENTG